VAQCPGDDRAAKQAIALESDQQLGYAVRRLGADEAAAHTERGEVRLVAGALGELGGAADQSLGVKCKADDGLGIQVNDETLLLGGDSPLRWDLGCSGRFLRAGASCISEHRKEL
jgi:hypothetical protein